MRAILTLLLAASVTHAQQDFAPPSPFTPDAETLAKIKVKTEELQGMLKNKDASPGFDDVSVYLKAAKWIVRHNEWYSKDSAKQTLAVLDAGLARAQHLETRPWLKLRGKAVVRGYDSLVDGSSQPYSVTYPNGFGSDGKKYLVEIHLHGRDATLTEVKFIASREAAKASNPDKVIVDVYGRGNNGYRWAGETDVLEVLREIQRDPNQVRYAPAPHLDDRPPILRGFSMGGGGTWAVGLHHPFDFCALQPGAGFTLTRGHAGKGFPEKLPDHQERTLRIYDVANCAENLANIPCVAYSGDKDPQIRAARNIEAALKDFKLPVKFEHVFAPGLEHKMPPEWKAKVDSRLAEFLPKDATPPAAFHYVTYTTAYPNFPCGGLVEGLVRHYERAVVDGRRDGDTLTLTTTNVSHLGFEKSGKNPPAKLVVDGTALPFAEGSYRRTAKGWEMYKWDPKAAPPRKQPLCQGPIDDAFMDEFMVVPSAKKAWHADIDDAASDVRVNFARLWDKHLRGDLRKAKMGHTHVYFGDPGSNPDLAEVLPQLPITWTKETLVMNGVSYDAKTHYPVLIYPDRKFDGDHRKYIVLNTGHTFGEADFKASNVMLYPRLGDWAVMKLAPTKANRHATEVVAAGLFDENWQFEKK